MRENKINLANYCGCQSNMGKRISIIGEFLPMRTPNSLDNSKTIRNTGMLTTKIAQFHLISKFNQQYITGRENMKMR